MGTANTSASAAADRDNSTPRFVVGFPHGHGKRHAISSQEMSKPRSGGSRRSVCGRLVTPEYTDNGLVPLAWPTNAQDYGCATCRARVNQALQATCPAALVTMRMTEKDAATLADAGVTARISDLLWLRTVLIEQRRRVRIAERDAFTERADRILRRLALAPDPPD